MTTWLPDTLLAGHVTHTWVLEGAEHVADEPDIPLTATLVRRGAVTHDRALIYLHGWNDYFFQTHVSAWFETQGFDFYALELRRYGRNLQDGLVPGYISDLAEYEVELDEAIEVVRQDHPGVPITVAGHSTGGLVVSLWADHRPGLLSGLILNSPWLDMQGSPVLWRVMSPVTNALGRFTPLTELNVGIDTGLYRRSLNSSMDGEWDWDLQLKSNPGFVPRFGWGRAIMAGHAQVAKGLHIDTPILVMTSVRSNFARTWDEAMHGQDIVLDVERIAAAAVHLGDQVTIRRFAGGVHDLVLSRRPVREMIAGEVSRWLDAYVRPEGLIERYRQELGEPPTA